MQQNTILREAELNPIWQEQDGLLIVEVESVPLKGIHTRALSFKGVWDEWVADTETRGHNGACCYRWGGPELTWNPGSGLLRYRIHIQTPGEYALAIRSRQADEATGDSVRPNRRKSMVDRSRRRAGRVELGNVARRRAGPA